MTSRHETWVWFFCIISFYLAVNIFQNTAARSCFERYAGLVMIPLCLIGLYQQCTKSPLNYGQLHLLGMRIAYGHWEISATLINSAVLAGFSLSWFFLLLSQSLKSRVQWVSLIACLVTLLLARSWWSFISLGVGLGYFWQEKLFFLYKKHARSLGLAATALAIALALLIRMKFSSSEGSYYQSNDRWTWWLASFHMFASHPWTGIGVGAYAAAFPFFKSGHAMNTLYAHSVLLQIATELGFFGMAACAAASVSIVRLLISVPAREMKNAANGTRVVAATLISVLCFSLITIYMDYFLSKLVIAIFLAYELSTRTLPRVWLSSASIMLITVGLTLLVLSWYYPLVASQKLSDGLLVEASDSQTAEQDFRQALVFDAYSDASDAALARLYQARYERLHSLTDLSDALLYRERAAQLNQRYTFPRQPDR